MESCAFAATALTNVSIPSTTEALITDPFVDCTKLSTVEIKGTKIRVDESSFRNCPVTLMVISNSCTTLNWADSPRDSSGNVTTLMNDNKVVFIYPAYLATLTEYTIPDKITSWSYQLPSNITKLIFPSSLSSVSAYMFPYNLSDITIDEENPIFSVLTIATHKFLCSNNKDGSINLRYLLKTSDKDIEIPSTIGNKSINELSSNVFRNLGIVNKVIVNSKSIADYAFNGNSVSSYIEIGPNVNSINTSFCGDGHDYKLIVNDQNEKYYVDKNSEILYEKDNNEYKIKKAIKRKEMTAFKIQKSINGLNVTSIGTDSFSNQTELKEIDLTNTNIEIIDNKAFEGCSAMNEIDISDKVTSIGSNCFTNCSNLTIYMPTTKENNKIAGAPWGATKGDRAVKWASQ